MCGGNKSYLLVEVQISMTSMLQARIRSQLESVSNVPQYEYPVCDYLDDSQMLKILPKKHMLFLLLYFSHQSKRTIEMNQGLILISSDSRLFRKDVSSVKGKHPMGLGPGQAYMGYHAHNPTSPTRP